MNKDGPPRTVILSKIYFVFDSIRKFMTLNIIKNEMSSNFIVKQNRTSSKHELKVDH